MSIAADASNLIPIVVLISGRGSNFRAIAERAARGELPVRIVAVISDKADAGGLDIARGMGIEARALSPREFASRTDYDAALGDLIAGFDPELIVLAGFMRILSAEFIERFHGRILNVHPSLLPNYKGLHTHRRVLEDRAPTHGVSVHFVTVELDGGPVIMQACLDVRPEDTEGTLSARVQRQEHIIYPTVVDWFARGRLALCDGRALLDGETLTAPVVVDARGE